MPCRRRAAHARIDPAHGCRPLFARSTRRSPLAVTVRDDVGIEAIAAADWNALARRPAARLARVPARAARDRLRVAAQPAGRRAISPPGATTRWSARCRSTPRRTPTASTSSIGRGPTPTAATAAATIRSSSRRFPSRRRQDLGCSRPTTPCAPRCCAPRWTGCNRRTGTAIRRTRRCTSCFPPRRRRAPARPPACSCATACSSAGRIPGYRDFADFLATFNHDKRKKVKQERRKRRRGRHRVHAQGRRRDHCRRLGVLPSLLRAHVPRRTIRRPTSTWNSSSASAPSCPGT